MKWRMRARHHRKILCVCALSILTLVLLSPVSSHAQDEFEDLTGVKVAVYTGGGVMGSSRIALIRMFEWMNATVGNITASQILEGQLNEYDILAIPGGSESTCSSELEREGKAMVVDFVDRGGSYFGICGGATFGVTYLRLFNGYISPGSESGDIIHMTNMTINQNSTGPNLSDLPETISTMYYASQYFTPKVGVFVHTVATYEYNDKPGMIAFKYGNGTVFLSSPHPEFEEDSDRDRTTFGDYLTDPDSEWPLMFRVSKWLIEASYVEPTSSTTTTTSLTTSVTTTTASSNLTTTNTNTDDALDIPLIVGASLSGVVIVLIAAVLYRRMHSK